jgi:HAD superfamily hydrolase (TIGR01509 family)
MRFADLDAVTVDGYGTLLRLRDPVPSLVRSLSERGLDRDPELVRAAFAAEVAYYRPEAVRGRDADSLAVLRGDCTGVFLRAAEADLEPSSFVDAFMASIRFDTLPGTVETLQSLRARGIELAVVSNWDVGLAEHLERLGIDRLFSAVVTSAEAGAAKPDPAAFRLVLRRLGVEPGRALHVGDEPEDEQGAAQAGMLFAHAPLETAFADWS